MKRIGLLFVLLGGLSLVLLPAIAYAQPPAPPRDIFQDACEDASGATLCRDNTTQIQNTGNNSLYGTNGVLTRAARLIAIVTGIASVIMIVIGGFKYVTSNGDPSKITSARDTILYALLGSALAATTQTIVILVLNRL